MLPGIKKIRLLLIKKTNYTESMTNVVMIENEADWMPKTGAQYSPVTPAFSELTKYVKSLPSPSMPNAMHTR